MKLVLLIIFFITSICSFAVDNPWLKTDYEKLVKKPECMIDFNKEYFINILEGYLALIEKGYSNGKPIRATQFLGFSMSVKQWLNFKYVEVDSNLSKNWFRKIIKIYDAMYKYSKLMDYADDTKNTKLYDAAKEKYKQFYKLLVKTLKNPERAKRRVRDALQIQKVKEYKAYQKYLEKQEEIEKADPR